MQASRGLEQADRQGGSAGTWFGPGDGDVGELVGANAGLDEMDKVLLGGPRGQASGGAGHRQRGRAGGRSPP